MTVTISTINKKHKSLFSTVGFQDNVRFVVEYDDEYQICFESNDNNYRTEDDMLIIGIEMLGLKSESRFHMNDEFLEEIHLQPMYSKLMAIADILDNLESKQSASKNWEFLFWNQLLSASDSIAFYSWLQGWFLVILYAFQIRRIRQWFGKIHSKLQPSVLNFTGYRI